jgi:hypothetical protein
LVRDYGNLSSELGIDGGEIAAYSTQSWGAILAPFVMGLIRPDILLNTFWAFASFRSGLDVPTLSDQ